MNTLKKYLWVLTFGIGLLGGLVLGYSQGEPSSECLNLARSATDMSDAYNNEDEIKFLVAELNARSFKGSC